MISDIRDGLAAALGKVPGLTAVEYVSDKVTAHQATVRRLGIEYNLVYGRADESKHTYRFELICYAKRTAEKAAQAYLDSLCEPSGATSVKLALEEDSNLAAVIDYVWVTAASEVQQGTVGAVDYLTVTFTLEVVAS